MRLRIFGIIWAVACVLVAVKTALQMLVTFAPEDIHGGDLAKMELTGIERARNFWIDDVWLSSLLLMLSSVIIVVALWKRPGRDLQ